jgi:carbonic anhydrase
MHPLQHLFDNNKRWVEAQTSRDTNFFKRLSTQQSPQYMWIGCSDSRVPANEIIGLEPGEVFVHRNVGNVVVHTDMNCLSVLQFAVEVLQVKHIIVCGHYGCGGVNTAMDHRQHGLIDNWLRHIKDVYDKYQMEVDIITDEELRRDRMCELNVTQQVANVCYTTIVQNAWLRGQTLSVHGWVYSVKDGLLKDLEITITGSGQLQEIFRMRKKG